jgi:hypothetical protein
MTKNTLAYIALQLLLAWCLVQLGDAAQLQRSSGNQRHCENAEAWLGMNYAPELQEKVKFSKFHLGDFAQFSYIGFERYELVNITIKELRGSRSFSFNGSGRLGFYNWYVCCFEPGTLVYVEITENPTDTGFTARPSCKANIYGLFRIKEPRNNNSNNNNQETAVDITVDEEDWSYFLGHTNMATPSITSNSQLSKSRSNNQESLAPLELETIGRHLARRNRPTTEVLGSPESVSVMQIITIMWNGFYNTDYVLAKIICPGTMVEKPSAVQYFYLYWKVPADFPVPQTGCFVNTTNAYIDSNGAFSEIGSMYALSEPFNFV